MVTLLLVQSALAGGVGLITTAGTHQEDVYAYDLDMNQYRIAQQRASTGVGIQGVLGDRDDRFVGLAKFYFINDSPPGTDNVYDGAKKDGYDGPANELTWAARSDSRQLGMAMAGVQWGLWGEPLGLQVNLITNLGASFATTDATEFLLAEIGGGVHYSINKRIQVNAEAAYHARYRKAFTHGTALNVGVRYYFD